MKMIELFKSAGYEDIYSLPIMERVQPKKNIEVISFNTVTKKEEWKRVTGLFYKGESVLEDSYEITPEGSKSFMCTGSHLFLINGNYTPCRDLVGYNDITSSLGFIRTLVQKSQSTFPILDIEVEDNNNYLSNGIVSHNSFGSTAKVFSEGLKKINPYLSRYKVSTILINQVRAKIGGFQGGFGPQESVPGGHAPKFYASWRARVSRGEDLMNKKEVIGNSISLRNVKSKICPPKRKVSMDLYYASGFDFDLEYIDFIIDLGYVTKGGAWLSNEEWGFKGQGKNALLDFLKANPDIFTKVKAKVNETFASKSVLDASDEGEDELDDEDYGTEEEV